MAIAKVPEKPIRYVELIRVSTRDQAERDTPEIQRTALDKLGAMRGGKFVERIEEPGGISGTLPLHQRPDLQRLKVLSDQKAFDEIRVYAIDRLTRSADPMERWAVYAMARGAGAIIVNADGTEINPADQVGEILFFFNSLGASDEAKKIKRRTRDGLKRAAAAGHLIGGSIYGIRWLKEEKRAEINEEEAANIRRIFDMCASGSTTGEIASALNADGVKAPRGGRWSRSTIGNYLRHRAFLGTFPKTADGVDYMIPVPQIVSQETWDQAQVTLDTNWKRPRRKGYRHDSLCRGRVYCGTCGRRMDICTTRSKKGRVFNHYRCSTSRSTFDGPACGNGYQRMLDVDEVVWNLLSERLRDPSLLLTAANAEPVPAADGSWERKINECEKALVNLRHKQELTLLLVGEDAFDAVKKRMTQLKNDVRLKQRELELAQRALARQEQARRDMWNVEQRLASIDWNLTGADFVTKRELMEVLVPEHRPYGVTIHDDGHIEVVGALDIDALPPSGGTGTGAVDRDGNGVPGGFAQSIGKLSTTPWCPA